MSMFLMTFGRLLLTSAVTGMGFGAGAWVVNRLSGRKPFRLRGNASEPKSRGELDLMSGE